MKKITNLFILFTVLLLVLSALLSITALAEDNTPKSWYYKKNGGSCPKFPSDSDFVTEADGYFVGNENEKVIYLTFDAGYENGNIEKILDILKDENVPAAFFILKNLVLKNPELIKRMANEGHLVCNHTKNHKDMTTLTEEEMKLNLKFLEDLCMEKCSVKMAKYFRFPEGRYSRQTILTAKEAGFKTIFWSLSHADWDSENQPNPEASIKHLLENTHPGAILLFHPTSQTNVLILPTLIKEWRSMGYRFGTLDELTGE